MCFSGNDAKSFYMTGDGFVLYDDFCASYNKSDVGSQTESKEMC